MKFELSRLLIPVIIILLIDLYSFQAVKTVTAGLGDTSRRWIYAIFWAITAITIASFLIGIFIKYNTWPKLLRVYLPGVLFAFYLGKIFIIIFLLIDDLTRLVRWIISKFESPADRIAPEDAQINRLAFLNKTAVIVAAIPLVTMTYGMLVDAFRYKVRKIKLTFSGLPTSFDGIRILQVSDIHSGSFVSESPLERAVSIINEQKPDVVFFTGDMVNNVASEVFPFIDIFKQINAPMGVFAILGNHDYGDYVEWDSKEAKQNNMHSLYDVYKKLGWPLLKNEHVHLERNGEKIAVAGVENWSAFSRFPKYGDLKMAMEGIQKGTFTILLSHDPTHWDAQVLPSDYNISLMLAGHTHGMQFGIETPKFRWSPSQYIFKQWAGLYRIGEQYLYVNRGLGFLGYPGRVGIRPEITVFELHKA